MTLMEAGQPSFRYDRIVPGINAAAVRPAEFRLIAAQVVDNVVVKIVDLAGEIADKGSFSNTIMKEVVVYNQSPHVRDGFQKVLMATGERGRNVVDCVSRYRHSCARQTSREYAVRYVVYYRIKYLPETIESLPGVGITVTAIDRSILK